MYKSVALFKRKEGITTSEFREYYENHHVPLKQRLLQLPGLQRYERRYLNPIVDPITDAAGNSGFDVITELWFEDKDAFDHYRKVSLEAEYRRITAEDEEKFLDRSRMFFHTVDERRTDVP